MHARLEVHLEQKFPVERGVSALTGAPPGEDNACVARSGVISRMIALVGIVRLWEQKDQRQLREKRWWCLRGCSVAHSPGWDRSGCPQTRHSEGCTK